MASRFRSSALLSALCITTLWAAGPRQYAPHWQVGDWWVTRTWQQFEHGSFLWHLERCDVTGIAKVDDRECFVPDIRLQSSKGYVFQDGDDFYVRRDDWRVVRRVTTRMDKDKFLPPDTANYPLGLFGPFPGEPRLPRFPLQFGSDTDTTFNVRQRKDSSVLVRELPGVAGPTLVSRLLNDGDTTGRHVVRPTDAVYQVRSELSSNPHPGIAPAERRITQSFQLWCDEQPWPVYEELVQYDGPNPVRWVADRTWLGASGHTDE